MCGRYALVDGVRIYLRWPHVDWHETRIEPRFNIAPSQLIPTIREARDGTHGEMMQWGFRPGWMKGSRLPPPINAKAESLENAGLWRSSLARARCLIPATGFYEWRTVPGQRAKQPLHIRLKNGEPFAFAGLFTRDAEGALTCAIVTTEPNDLMAAIHTRMPAILTPDDEHLWLDRTVTDAGVARACLRGYDASAMEAYVVADDVGNHRNDGPGLIEPLG